MKKKTSILLPLALASLGLASCSSSSAVSLNNVSDSEITYEEYNVPSGENMTSDEFNYMTKDASATHLYLKSVTSESLLQTTSTALYGGAAYGAYRQYSEQKEIDTLTIYENGISFLTTEVSSKSSANGGNKTTMEGTSLLYYGSPDNENYYLYNDYDVTLGGVNTVDYSILSSATGETAITSIKAAYSEQVYQTLFSHYPYTLSSSSYSYLKADNGDIYATYVSVSRSTMSTYNDVTIPYYTMTANQYVYKSLSDYGYVFKEYSSKGLRWYSHDAKGNELSSPLVYYKETTKEVYEYGEKETYAEEVTYYEAKDTSSYYDVNLVCINGEGTLLTSFSDVTSTYKAYVDPDYDGYAYQISSFRSEGDYLITAIHTGEDETTSEEHLYSYSDIGEISDITESVYEGSEYATYASIHLGDHYYRLLLLISKDGKNASLSINLVSL